MSDPIPANQADIPDPQLKAAVQNFEQYRHEFEATYGYGIGATSHLTPDGRVETVLQLVKLPPKPSDELSEEDMRMAEVPDPETVPATPTENANPTTEETGESTGGEQPAPVTA